MEGGGLWLLYGFAGCQTWFYIHRCFASASTASLGVQYSPQRPVQRFCITPRTPTSTTRWGDNGHMGMLTWSKTCSQIAWCGVRRQRLSFPPSYTKSTTFFSPFTTSPVTSTPRPMQSGKSPWRRQVRRLCIWSYNLEKLILAHGLFCGWTNQLFPTPVLCVASCLFVPFQWGMLGCRCSKKVACRPRSLTSRSRATCRLDTWLSRKPATPR